MSISKFVQDGRVAVLYSPGFGAGWHSWNSDTEQCLFEPEIVQMVLDQAATDAIEARAKELWPTGYWGGARDLTIEWMRPGACFKIDEYDGSETIDYVDEIYWHVA